MEQDKEIKQPQEEGKQQEAQAVETQQDVKKEEARKKKKASSPLRLQTKDFISVGIFSLIYAAVAFVVGALMQMTPFTFPFMPPVVAIFTGTVFMLYVAKTPKRWALTIMGAIGAILLFVTGMFWMMSVFFLVFGFIADLICASGKFRSFRRNMIGYCVMALAPMGAYVPMALMPAQFDAFMKTKGNAESFAEVIRMIGGNWWPVPLMALVTIICALIGGFIGKLLLKKHFEKAGIV